MRYARSQKKEADASGAKPKARSLPANAPRIGDANGASEREADRVANEVMAGGSAKQHWSISGVNMTAPVQRKASGPAAAADAPPVVHQVLDSPGRPLDRASRDFFEPKFGHDLGDVRLHTDGQAADSARAVSASAYTVGNDVVFGPGTSPHQKPLLAHELAHVVQQSRGGATTSLDPHSPLERDADRAAGAAVSGLPAEVKGSASPSLARATPGQGYASSVGELKEPAVLTAIPGAKGVPPKFPGYDGFVGGQVSYTQTVEGRGASQYTVINENVKDAEWITIISPESATVESVRSATNRKLLAALRLEDNPRPFPADPVEISPGVKLRVIKDGPAARIRVVVNLPDKVDPELLAKLQAEAADVLKRSPKLSSLADPPQVVTHVETFQAPGPPAAGSGSAPAGEAKPIEPGAPAAGAKPSDAPTPAADITPSGAAGAADKGAAQSAADSAGSGAAKSAPQNAAGGATKDAVQAGGEGATKSALEGTGTGAARGLAESAGEGAVRTAVGKGTGVAADVSLSGAAAGALEAAVLIGITLGLQALSAKLFDMAFENDVDTILRPSLAKKLTDLQPKLAELQGTKKLFIRVTYDFTFQRDDDSDPVVTIVSGSPPFYEIGSLGHVNVHPGNEELDFPSSRSESVKKLLPPRQRVTAQVSYSVLIDDAPKRAREAETKKAAEALSKAKPSQPLPPPPQAPAAAAAAPFTPLTVPAPPTAPPVQFLSPPGGPAQEPRVEEVVAYWKARSLNLKSRGERIHSTSSPSRDEMKSFLNDESIWRNAVTIWDNHYIEKGPDYGHRGMDELRNSDEYGGRLRQLADETRNRLGG